MVGRPTHGDAKTVAKFGFYKTILIIIDLGSLKTYTAYLKGDSSREFIEAMDNIRKQLHLETGNRLKYVTSDAFSTVYLLGTHRSSHRSC